MRALNLRGERFGRLVVTDSDTVRTTMRGLVPVPAMFSSLCSDRGSKAERGDTTSNKRPKRPGGSSDEIAAS